MDRIIEGYTAADLNAQIIVGWHVISIQSVPRQGAGYLKMTYKLVAVISDKPRAYGQGQEWVSYGDIPAEAWRDYVINTGQGTTGEKPGPKPYI